MDIRIRKGRRHFDSRGWLLKVAPDPPAAPGISEAYVVQAGRGSVRGNHYHRACFEWFTPLRGRGRLLLTDPTTGEHQSVPLSGDTPITVEVRPGIAHALVPDPGGDLWVLALASHPYDPDDVVSFPVEPPTGTTHDP